MIAADYRYGIPFVLIIFGIMHESIPITILAAILTFVFERNRIELTKEEKVLLKELYKDEHVNNIDLIIPDWELFEVQINSLFGKGLVDIKEPGRIQLTKKGRRYYYWSF